MTSGEWVNWKAALLAAALALSCHAAVAQTTPVSLPKPLLSGTTSGLAWGIYAGRLTSASLLEEGQGLRVGVPAGASVLGTRYDAAQRTALLTYRLPRGLDARSALAFATNQLQLQGFDIGERSFPTASSARAALSRDGQGLTVQTTRQANGDTQVLYVFGAAAP
ncbi:hypothetical protein GCM10010840_23150 [Deinococcus aerolatus]|uniref:Uncharacterized protein n=1 Tax=Deinococcus aerolatus TaxID=522487 RepID=A0ABQ2GBH9_9DEIO|nr:hypothetical protein [Deinococcus aerolatus]GGL84641.1 hypothetical protein GCM10010840_23150 [Deinococcus aerolatus]